METVAAAEPVADTEDNSGPVAARILQENSRRDEDAPLTIPKVLSWWVPLQNLDWEEIHLKLRHAERLELFVPGPLPPSLRLKMGQLLEDPRASCLREVVLHGFDTNDTSTMAILLGAASANPNIVEPEMKVMGNFINPANNNEFDLVQSLESPHETRPREIRLHGLLANAGLNFNNARLLVRALARAKSVVSLKLYFVEDEHLELLWNDCVEHGSPMALTLQTFTMEGALQTNDTEEDDSDNDNESSDEEGVESAGGNDEEEVEEEEGNVEGGIQNEPRILEEEASNEGESKSNSMMSVGNSNDMSGHTDKHNNDEEAAYEEEEEEDGSSDCAQNRPRRREVVVQVPEDLLEAERSHLGDSNEGRRDSRVNNAENDDKESSSSSSEEEDADDNDGEDEFDDEEEEDTRRIQRMRALAMPEATAQALKNFLSFVGSSLREFTMEDRRIDLVNLNVFAEGWMACAKIETISLDGCCLLFLPTPYPDGSKLQEFFSQSRSLRELILTNCIFPHVMVMWLFSQTLSSKETKSKLPAIHLHNLKIMHDVPGWKIGKSFECCMENLPNLERLLMGGNSSLGNEGIAFIARAIQLHCSRLVRLDVTDCGFDDVGMTSLVKGLVATSSESDEKTADCVTESQLATLSSVRALCLDRNSLGSSGVCTVSEYLQHPTCNLQDLSLNVCNINDNALCALIAGMKKSKSLESLRLSYNALVSVNGWSHFAESLQDFMSLKALELHRPPLGTQSTPMAHSSVARKEDGSYAENVITSEGLQRIHDAFVKGMRNNHTIFQTDVIFDKDVNDDADDNNFDMDFDDIRHFLDTPGVRLMIRFQEQLNFFKLRNRYGQALVKPSATSVNTSHNDETIRRRQLDQQHFFHDARHHLKDTKAHWAIWFELMLSRYRGEKGLSLAYHFLTERDELYKKIHVASRPGKRQATLKQV